MIDASLEKTGVQYRLKETPYYTYTPRQAGRQQRYNANKVKNRGTGWLFMLIICAPST